MQIVPPQSGSDKESPPPRSRSRTLLADALEAVTDYAATVQRSQDGLERGRAAHAAGKAVIALGEYAEELEDLIAAARDAGDWSGLA